MRKITEQNMNRSRFLPLVALFYILFSFSFAHAATMHTANNNGLVGYWSFNEGTSTIAHDFSGKGNNGTLSGTTLPQWTNGRLGRGLSFDGSTSHVPVSNYAPYSLGASDITVSVWVKANVISGNQDLVSKRGTGSSGTNKGWGVRIQGSYITIEYDDGTANSIAGSPQCTGQSLVANTWYHVVVTFAHGSVATCYINGQSAGTINISLVGDVTNASRELWFGEAPTSAYTFNGMLDEVRIYNRALSQAEITGLYWAGLAVVNTSKVTDTAKASTLTSGLVGWWTMDGGDTLWTSGTTGNEADKSGNLNTATLNGMTRARSPVAGKIGQGFSYGNAGFLNAGSNSSLNVGAAFTYSIWVKRSGTSVGHWPEILWSGDTHVYYGIRSTNYGDDIVFEYGTSPYDGVAGHYTNINCGGVGNLSNDTWTLFTVTYDGSNVMCYKNGAFTTSRTGAVLNPSFSVVKVLDGGFSGSIDDARIYNRPLSAAEVKQLYLQGGGVALNTSAQNLDNGSTLGSGLVGYWTFDGSKTQGTIADSSGQGNDGYVAGGVATSSIKVAGKLGQALAFTGSNYIVVPNSSSLQVSPAITVSTWIKVASNNGTYREIVRKSIASDGYFLLLNTSNKIAFAPSGSAAEYTNGFTYAADNKWHLVTGTFNGTTVSMYLDGVFQTSYAGAALSTNTTPLGIGGASSGAQRFTGLIDDVRIYNKSLTATEVKQLYNMGR